jgi:hypothetical protein
MVQGLAASRFGDRTLRNSARPPQRVPDGRNSAEQLIYEVLLVPNAPST